MKGRRKIEPRGGMKFRALIVAAAATFALAAGARQTDGFSFAEDGIVTPRGRIAWNDVLKVRLYERPTQKLKDVGVRVKVGLRTDDRVHLDCTETLGGSYVPVQLDLDGTYLRVSVESGDIVEPLGCSYRVMELTLLPGLLDARPEEPGRYLLPVFAGGLASFKADAPRRSRDRIYVQQNDWEKMGMINAFGASWQDEGGILGIVHTGDYNAWVDTSAAPPGGRASQAAVLQIREDPADVQSFERKELLYRWLPGARTWCGLALAFGEYLRDERGLLPLEVREKGNPQLGYILSAVRINIFMGLKQPFIPDGSSPYFSATTFAEAERIVDEVRSRGIDKAWFCLVGWIKDGHDGAYPSHFPVNEAAGGEAALRRLIAKIRGYGYAVTPHDNIHSCYASSPDYDNSIPCRTRAGEELPMGIWSGGMIRIGCPHLYVARYGGDFARIRDLGFEGIYYIDALMPPMFRCYDPRHPASEREFIEGQLRVLGWVRSEYGVSATETHAVPTLRYIDYGSNGASGDRVFYASRLPPDAKAMLERYVPFLGVASHGLVAYQTKWIHAVRSTGGWIPSMVDGGLPAAETSMRNGANGDYYLDSLDELMEPWRLCFKVAPEFSRGVTAGFEELAPDAVRWRFHNGLELHVNGTRRRVGDMPPMSVRALRGGKEIYFADAVAGAYGRGALRPAARAYFREARAAYRTPEYAAGTNSIIGRYSREAPYGPDAAGDFPDLKRDGATDEPVVWGVNGLRNVRDIGGWTGLKTGMVYRGSKLVRADAFADGVDPETRRVVRDVWRLASDVDLRGKSEYGPAKTNLVELQSMGVPKLAFPIRAYEHIFDKPKLFGDVLRALARPEAYPAYIHCSGGADRTGTLVFVLEALCGVPEADLDVDYELTSFASVFGMRDRNEILTISLRRLKERFRRYPGATLNECVENACVDAFGLTREEIASIRRILKPSN